MNCEDIRPGNTSLGIRSQHNWSIALSCQNGLGWSHSAALVERFPEGISCCREYRVVISCPAGEADCDFS